jgi:hypothetical protein
MPDIPSDECRRDQWAAQSIFAVSDDDDDDDDDDYLEWMECRHMSSPIECAIEQIFERVKRGDRNMREDQSNQ